MNLHVVENIDVLSREAAAWITGYINEVLEYRPRFSLVLSGGSTPKKLHQVLASDYHDKVDWTRVDFFWGDERYVPFTDERNNARMAFQTLLDHLPVNKDQVHIMRTDIPPEASAAAYNALLHKYFEGKDQTFDLVLLGLGDNAHTLSIFPGSELLDSTEWVASTWLEEQNMFRITLTALPVNEAVRVVFLLAGADKQWALEGVLADEGDLKTYPARIIQPSNGELYFWTDEAAARNIAR